MKYIVYDSGQARARDDDDVTHVTDTTVTVMTYEYDDLTSMMTR